MRRCVVGPCAVARAPASSCRRPVVATGLQQQQSCRRRVLVWSRPRLETTSGRPAGFWQHWSSFHHGSFSALTLLVGRHEGHPACKKTEWRAAGVVICLERWADLHMAQLMPLPLTVSCFSKIQIGFAFLAPAHLGSPGQRTVKRVCVCVVFLTPLGPDLQKISRQSYDYLTIMPKLRSTYDGRLVYDTPYEERRAFLSHDSAAKSQDRLKLCSKNGLRYS